MALVLSAQATSSAAGLGACLLYPSAAEKRGLGFTGQGIGFSGTNVRGFLKHVRGGGRRRDGRGLVESIPSEHGGSRSRPGYLQCRGPHCRSSECALRVLCLGASRLFPESYSHEFHAKEGLLCGPLACAGSCGGAQLGALCQLSREEDCFRLCPVGAGSSGFVGIVGEAPGESARQEARMSLAAAIACW